MKRMKRILFLALMIVTISCDPTIYDDFIIVNNCEEDISVNIIFFHEDTMYDFIVKAKKDSLFITTEGVGPLSIESGYKQITITKNGKVSQENYVNQAKWEKIKVDKTHREWYLYVNPEDFEE